MLNLEQCKEICTSGWPSNQREQARFDAEQWLIQEVERLTIESDGNINEGFNMASDYLSRSHTDQADEIASLNQQLEEANKETEGRRHDLAEFARITSQTVSDLKQQLAAAQSTNAKMREALESAESALDECRDYPVTYDEVMEALALPNDDTALNQYRDSVIEECAKKLEYYSIAWAGEIRKLKANPSV